MDLVDEIRLYEQARRDKLVVRGWALVEPGMCTNGEDEGLDA